MTDEQVSLLVSKIDSLIDALRLNMGIPTDLSEEELTTLMNTKKQTSIINSEIQLLYAQRELKQLQNS